MNNLKTSFGKKKVSLKFKTSLVQKVFTDVAKKYDLMNDLMSFGTHRLWKKELIDFINIQKKDKIIDVGSGTGDIISLILEKKLFNILYSVDLNKKMLSFSKKKFQNKKVKFINANAENLNFKNDFFDKYIISFCLRNVTHVDKALREAFRVLKPGGAFYCLEFSMPNSSWINLIYSKYKSNIIPILGDKISKNRDAYKYLEESISNFPQQEILIKKINNVGFVETSYVNLFDGIVSIHKGFKI